MMKAISTEQLDAMIREEKRLIIRDLVADAWELGIEAGIEPQFLAEHFVTAAIEELFAAEGAHSAEKLASRLSQAIEGGLVPIPRQLQ
jgi:hypothetical protein